MALVAKNHAIYEHCKQFVFLYAIIHNFWFILTWSDILLRVTAFRVPCPFYFHCKVGSVRSRAKTTGVLFLNT